MSEGFIMDPEEKGYINRHGLSRKVSPLRWEPAAS